MGCYGAFNGLKVRKQYAKPTLLPRYYWFALNYASISKKNCTTNLICQRDFADGRHRYYRTKPKTKMF